LGALLVIAVVGYSATRYFIDRSNYNKGHQAYQQADCAIAIRHFDSIISGWRLVDIGGYSALAQQEKAECLSFQAAVDKQQAGDRSAALIAYADFVSDYSSSVLAEAARNRSASLFEQAKPSALASQESCQKIDILLEEDLIPQRDVNLPLFYLACGQAYEDAGDWANAVTMYESFLAEYPSHSLASDVEAALARSIVAQAKAAGAGEIPAPSLSGSTGSGFTEVVIQNDSPERLRIVFSGPESRVEELGACSSCQTYFGIGPLFCPEQGPIGRYTLKPGQYDVVVESISDTGVTPWIGDWSLVSGDEYYSCFFIVTTFGP